MSTGVVAGSAVDIAVVAVALDLGRVIIEEGKTGAATSEDLIYNFRKSVYK